MLYKTEILPPTKENISLVAKLLKNGEIAAIPTETVYGLAANAFDENAVKKIFEAKGRPQDNPLIVHIADIKDLDALIVKKPKIADKIIDLYWPGPLTLIFEKSDLIPNVVSAGLNTVAIRLPNNNITRQIIRAVGSPLAAPSANTSSRPSPTEAIHVFNDLHGKIPYIINGGQSDIGLESTVLSLVANTPTVLRPGKITIENLKETLGNIDVNKYVLQELDAEEISLSPGMKHKHYAPTGELKLFVGDAKSFSTYVNSLAKNNVYALCFNEDMKNLNVPYVSYGSRNNYDELSKNLFSSLRKLDKANAKHIIAHAPEKRDLGFSIYNRLLRSANYEVIDYEK